MRFRDWATIAALLSLIGLTYAYMAAADESSACRDWMAISERGGP